MKIEDQVAVITGAAGGIGRALSKELSTGAPRAIGIVDASPAALEVADDLNQEIRPTRRPSLCRRHNRRSFPQAGLRRPPRDTTSTRPSASRPRPSRATTSAIRVHKETHKATIYPVETFRKVTEVNFIAPIYWALETVAGVAEDRSAAGLKRWHPDEEIQGTIILIGSIASSGNKGQISYSSAKAGLEGAAATLAMEAIYHGVRCGVIHPGFTDTPMVQALGQDYIDQKVLPQTQLGRLISPEEIADAICFMIGNSAVSGQLWADAGWRPAV